MMESGLLQHVVVGGGRTVNTLLAEGADLLVSHG